MELILKRMRFKDKYTTGQLYVDGTFFCFTLEDKVREELGVPVEKWKIHGETAIPMGLYRVTLENSPKFGLDTMTINQVPGFSKIRIHAGNTHEDTEGCVIVGYKIREDGVIVPGTTKTCVLNLKTQIKQAGGEATIRIMN